VGDEHCESPFPWFGGRGGADKRGGGAIKGRTKMNIIQGRSYRGDKTQFRNRRVVLVVKRGGEKGGIGCIAYSAKVNSSPRASF